VVVAFLFSGDFERQAASAILQAQRDIAAVQEVHVEVDPAALRAAEANLFAAYTAFNERRYEAAFDAASRASQAAQHLLASRAHNTSARHHVFYVLHNVLTVGRIGFETGKLPIADGLKEEADAPKSRRPR
jgi:hypothetical protein